MFTYRGIEARPADEAFLEEMAALFGQGTESPATRPWGEPEDFGLIAEEDAEKLGAGWYRRHRPSGGTESGAEFREVFIAVRPENQRRGIGTELWRRLLAQASADRTVDFLIALVRPESAGWSVPLLEAAGFKPRDPDSHVVTWLLWVGEGRPPAIAAQGGGNAVKPPP
jgi:GNAT superfamily N-acetyltransferase